VQDDLTLALISDAGTPCVSDPGYHLIKEAHQRRIPVHPIPGPSAALALLSAAGLPCDRFSFVGFLPSRPKAVKAEITGWTPRMGTILFFESVRRLQRAVRLIAETYPAAEIAIGRELTKLHEDIYSGPIANARWFLEQETVLKGEAVVAVSLPADADGDESSNAQREELMTLLRRDLADGATFKDLLQRYKDRNISRSDLYQMMVRIKEGGDDE
jgi:16S rRNA (cytidine1402-2'-O)-methyltransferase